MKKLVFIFSFFIVFSIFGCTNTNQDQHFYDIKVVNDLPKDFYVGTDDIDFKPYFTITDSKGNNVSVLDSMIDTSQVDFNTVGDYEVKLTYKDTFKSITISIIDYQISINESLPTEFYLGNEMIDFKPYFTIIDSKGNNVPVLDSMIDTSQVDFNTVGEYEVKLTFKSLVKSLTINIIEKITYEIKVNESLPREFYTGQEDIDFKPYFTITDSNGIEITVLDEMLESNVDFTDAGEYYVKLSYQNQSKEIKINVEYKEVIDFAILFNMIKNLTLNNKGTATSEEKIIVRGTVYMDVKSETKLVYLTDGKYIIKLHGEKMHNYTTEGNVYEIVCHYKAHIYQPSLEVINPANDIKFIKDAESVTSIEIKEVTLSEILNLKRENFVENINNGYLQSMLKVTGFLHLDTHNSNKYDYLLTLKETYTKNKTGYIQDGLYFKNQYELLERHLIDYEVVKGEENVTIAVYGVLYEWNTNRQNWMMYMDEALTINNLGD